MKRKAQSAMEYLMTYGWAIIILVVVVGALYVMGVFKTGTTVACSNPCFGSQFTYNDHNQDTLVLTNGPRRIQIQSIEGIPQSGSPQSLSSDVNDVEAGGKIRITITPITSRPLTVNITYLDVDSQLSHWEAGVLRK
ncbi:MAG: hypothetical protein QXM68_02385 [Candidatus Aenigmatarchaeota archaeon]|nr:hypothetical protein [Candidatus Aenigmarchaeota archaeon]